MADFTRSWNEADPADGDQAKYGAQEIRDLKVDVRERLALEHLGGTLITDPFGMHAWKTVAKSGDYTLTNLDHIILASGSITLTLPTAVGFTGKSFIIKNVGTDLVTITTTGGQTIDGLASVKLQGSFSWFGVVSNGTNWIIYLGNIPVLFSVNKAGVAQSIPTDTATKVTWSTEDFDTQDFFASDKFTPTLKGNYQLHASLTYLAMSASKLVYCSLYKNGGLLKGFAGVVVDGTNLPMVQVTAVVEANGTDYFEVYAYHNAGWDININGNPVYTYFQGYRIS